MQNDNVFQMSASNIRFGAGCTAEVGSDLRDLSARRTMVLIDPNLRSLPTAEVVINSLKEQGIDFAVFDEVSVEPTDSSFQHAAAVADEQSEDAAGEPSNDSTEEGAVERQLLSGVGVISGRAGLRNLW